MKIPVTTRLAPLAFTLVCLVALAAQFTPRAVGITRLIHAVVASLG